MSERMTDEQIDKWIDRANRHSPYQDSSHILDGLINAVDQLRTELASVKNRHQANVEYVDRLNRTVGELRTQLAEAQAVMEKLRLVVVRQNEMLDRSRSTLRQIKSLSDKECTLEDYRQRIFSHAKKGIEYLNTNHKIEAAEAAREGGKG